MRLTLKLTIGLILAILPVIAVNSGVRVRREIAASEADLRDDDLVVGRTLAGSVAAIWRSVGETEARALIDGANARQHRVAIRWVWLDAAAGASDAPAAPPGELADRESRVVRARPDTMITYVALTTPSGRRGAIEVQRPLAAESSFITQTVRHAAVAAAVVIGLCGCLALGLGALFVGRPVQRLVAQTRRIGAGDLSARSVLSTHDELGQLGAEIDVMANRLDDARDRLASATAARLVALEQLRHADRLATVGKLAAGIAHELGTPLNVISGHAQLITTDRENAAIIVEQTQRLVTIIRQLLSFARRHAPCRTPLELGPVVAETVALLGPLAAERRISIDLEAEPVMCDVDAGQLQQALANLVVNAMQASAAGQRVTIAVARTPDGQARIDVTDTGAGIAPDVVPHIFEPFFTTKGVGEGTGLGLSVTYGIVEEHDGRIEVVSQLGVGSHFSLYLPIHPEGIAS